MLPFLSPPTPCAPNSTSRPARGLLDATPHRNSKPAPRRSRRQGGRITTSSSSSILSAAQDLIADVPTPRAFSALFKAASSATSPSPTLGAQLHSQALVRGFLSDGDNTILSTAILNFYASCREPDLARQVFDAMARESRNAVTWNALIKGYAQAGRWEEALEFFRDMRRQGHVAPDNYTFPALLSGIGREHGGGCMQEFGGALHAQAIKSGLHRDPFVGASLVSMYAAIGALEGVKLVFDDVDTLDPVVWSAMISAYVTCKEEEGALLTFYKMLCRDIKPRQFVYSSLFAICGSMSLLEMGRQVHAHSLKNITDKDADEVTLLNLLSAFNHAGLVHEGLHIFGYMLDMEGIKPTYQHYACVIDMLARSGEIGEAMKTINEMPFEAETPLWRIVLGACSKHRDIGTGVKIAEMLFEMEPYEATNYILLGNIYTRLGRWTEAEKVRSVMDKRGIDSYDAFSWIEMGKKTHRFGVADRSHPISEEIYKNLDRLIGTIKALLLGI